MNDETVNELMTITAEECGELTQACMKINRWGLYDGNENITNRERLLEEAGDVMCMIDIMIEKGILTKNEINDRMIVKREKLKQWSNLFNET